MTDRQNQLFNPTSHLCMWGNLTVGLQVTLETHSSVQRISTHFGPGSIVETLGIHGSKSSRLKRQRPDVWESANLGRDTASSHSHHQ